MSVSRRSGGSVSSVRPSECCGGTPLREDEAGAAAVAAAVDPELGGDARLQLGHVADHADHPPSVTERVEGVHHVLEGLGVERTEPLVDEEGVEVGTARLLGDHVGEAEGQRERRDEGLAARERGRVAAVARPVVADEQAEAARVSPAPRCPVWTRE